MVDWSSPSSNEIWKFNVSVFIINHSWRFVSTHFVHFIKVRFSVDTPFLAQLADCLSLKLSIKSNGRCGWHPPWEIFQLNQLSLILDSKWHDLWNFYFRKSQSKHQQSSPLSPVAHFLFAGSLCQREIFENRHMLPSIFLRMEVHTHNSNGYSDDDRWKEKWREQAQKQRGYRIHCERTRK